MEPALRPPHQPPLSSDSMSICLCASRARYHVGFMVHRGRATSSACVTQGTRASLTGSRLAR
eukprot:27754-Eustigmatos_ZCMA.PRE.1